MKTNLLHCATAVAATLALVATSACSIHLGGSRRPRTARDTVVVTQPAIGGGPVVIDEHHHRHHHRY